MVHDGAAGVAARGADGGGPVPGVVRRELREQRGRQAGADRLPVPDDGDHGAATVHRGVQPAGVRGVRRAPRDRLPAALLLAHARAARIRKVPHHSLLASLYMESSYIICTYW